MSSERLYAVIATESGQDRVCESTPHLEVAWDALDRYRRVDPKTQWRVCELDRRTLRPVRTVVPSPDRSPR